MAQAEPSTSVTTSRGRYATPVSSSSSREYKPPALSEAQVLAAIKKSKEQGWSELADRGPSSYPDPRVIWEELKRNSRLFRDVGEGEVKLGRVIASGGRSQIYEASHGGGEDYSKVVAKVVKVEGFSVSDFKRQWPLATKATSAIKPVFRGLDLDGVIFGQISKVCNHLHLGTFLKDGRFAVVLPKFWGDLRKLIDVKLREKNFQGPPFSYPQALWIMNKIATGMQNFHARGVLHKDLKAANVLFFNLGGRFGSHFCVEDFETSPSVKGTGFWRAPEVLEELLKEDRNEKIWTEKVDIYSYGMTCYEVLTGHIPFFGYDERDWERVIDGERPHLPDYVDAKLQEIIEKCWHKEPSKRPTFDNIQIELENLVRPINMEDSFIDVPPC